MRDAYITLFKLTPGARYKARQDALRYLRLASDYGSWLQDDMSTSLGSRAPTVKLPAVEFVLSPHEEGSDSEANIQQVCSSSFEARGNMTSWDSLPGSGSFEPLIYVEARTATLLLTLLRHRKENAGLYTTVLEGESAYTEAEVDKFQAMLMTSRRRQVR